MILALCLLSLGGAVLAGWPLLGWLVRRRQPVDTVSEAWLADHAAREGRDA